VGQRNLKLLGGQGKTDGQPDQIGIKGHFYCYFLLFNRGPWPLILLLRNEFYCSLLFCLQLDGPLSLFGSAGRRRDGQTAKLIPVYPPYNFVVQGYKKQTKKQQKMSLETDKLLLKQAK
jgi:hypothetical protein